MLVQSVLSVLRSPEGWYPVGRVMVSKPKGFWSGESVEIESLVGGVLFAGGFGVLGRGLWQGELCVEGD